MRIIEYRVGKVEPSGKKAAIALGLFDGVHLGHRRLIEQVTADERYEPTVFTFKSGTGIKGDAKMIYPDSVKYKMLEELGIKTVVVADFTELCNMSGEEFVRDVLYRDLGAARVVAGVDYRFGRAAGDDIESLMKYSYGLGVDCIAVDIKTVVDKDGVTRKISSSEIREYMAAGDIKGANELLGAPYHIEGVVERGRGVGRTLGYPTVNIPLQNDSPLKSGVYKTLVKIGGKSHTGLTNVGICPTFEPRERHTETYLIDFEGDIYSEALRVEFIDFIREERRFGSEAELVREIEKNITKIKETR